MCVVLCELTVSVRITAISVEVTVVDEDDNDTVLGGDIDSEGGAGAFVSVWIAVGIGGWMVSCVPSTVKSYDTGGDNGDGNGEDCGGLFKSWYNTIDGGDGGGSDGGGDGGDDGGGCGSRRLASLSLSAVTVNMECFCIFQSRVFRFWQSMKSDQLLKSWSIVNAVLRHGERQDHARPHQIQSMSCTRCNDNKTTPNVQHVMYMFALIIDIDTRTSN